MLSEWKDRGGGGDEGRASAEGLGGARWGWEWSRRRWRCRRRPDCLPMAPSATRMYPFTPFLYLLPSRSGISIRVWMPLASLSKSVGIVTALG